MRLPAAAQLCTGMGAAAAGGSDLVALKRQLVQAEKARRQGEIKAAAQVKEAEQQVCGCMVAVGWAAGVCACVCARVCTRRGKRLGSGCVCAAYGFCSGQSLSTLLEARGQVPWMGCACRGCLASVLPITSAGLHTAAYKVLCVAVYRGGPAVHKQVRVALCAAHRAGGCCEEASCSSSGRGSGADGTE